METTLPTITEINKKENSGMPKKLLRTMLVVFILAVVAIIPGIIVNFLVNNISLESYNLEIKLIDIEGEKFLPNAEIYLDGLTKGVTDSNGILIINKVSSEFLLEIKAIGFAELSRNVLLKGIGGKAFLNLGLYRVGDSFITGSLISGVPNYNFNTDKLFLNDVALKINSNGEFSSGKQESGKLTFKFISKFFKDIKTEVELKSGANKLEPIKLIPAGDLVGNLKSYVREDVVPEIKFSVENVLPSQIKIDDNSNFTVSDLEVDTKYKVRIEASGYSAREYFVTLKQGENSILELKLVEEGTVFFNSAESKLVTSSLDGFLVKDTGGISPYNISLSGDSKKVFFQSQYKRINSLGTKPVGIIYFFDTELESITQVTQNMSGLGDIFPSYNAGLLYSVPRESSQTRTLLIADLTGNNRVEVKQIDSKAIISGGNFSIDKKYFYFAEKINSSSTIYQYNLETKELLALDTAQEHILWDINTEGKILFSRQVNSIYQLAFFDPLSSQIVVVKDRIEGQNFLFMQNNPDIILFFNNGVRAELKKIDITSFTESEIFFLSGSDKFETLFEQGSFWFYKTSNKLYVFDLNTPLIYKKVADL